MGYVTLGGVSKGLCEINWKNVTHFLGVSSSSTIEAGIFSRTLAWWAFYSHCCVLAQHQFG